MCAIERGNFPPWRGLVAFYKRAEAARKEMKAREDVMRQPSANVVELAEIILARYPSAKLSDIEALSAEIQQVIDDFCADFDDQRRLP